MQVYAPGADLLVRMLQDRKLLLGDTSSAAVLKRLLSTPERLP